MTEPEFKELIRILTQPHRVQNVFALFKHCEEAATLLQQQKAEINKLKTAMPEKTEKPKKATSSKKKRARDEKGRLIGDDPNTEINEAWVSDTPEGTA